VANEYPEDVRREARRLWLTKRFNDEEIAARLGIPRADTIRDWRHQEGWTALACDISSVIRDEVKLRARAERGAFNAKYDQLAQVVENRAVRAFSDPGLSPRDVKVLAGALAIAQKIRAKALGADAEHPDDQVPRSMAEAVMRAKEARAERERGTLLGRCRTEGGDGEADTGRTMTSGTDPVTVAPA
jgi:hypothetical protein